jgi:threonine 3-dehydrogenase
MAVLITGGSGFIGSLLVRELLNKGEKVVVFDIQTPGKPVSDGQPNVFYQKGNITNLPEVLNVVRDHGIDQIFHLAAMLSLPSEMNPWASINVNAIGTYHVLEAARLFKVDQVLLTSSVAVYLNSPDPDTIVTEETALRPRVIYGVTKVFGELLGLYYENKFRVDVRGIRLPQLIGPWANTPGFGQYYSKMIESAILGMPYEVNVPEDTVAPVLYVKDAVRGMLGLSEAPKERVATRIYNLGQIMPPHP